MLTGLNQCAGLNRPVANHTVKRCINLGIVECLHGKVTCRFCLTDSTFSFDFLGLQNAKAAFFNRHGRIGSSNLRLCFLAVGFGIVKFLAAGSPLFDQIVIALEIFGRAIKLDLGDPHIGVGLRDRGFLKHDLLIHRGDGCTARFECRICLRQFKTVIFVLDRQQQIAFAYRLVFINPQLTNIARDLGRNGNLVGLQIGIVGIFEILTLGHPVEPVISTATDNRRCDQGQDDFLHTHDRSSSFWY